MDLKIPSDTPSIKAASPLTGDLLAKLRAAGRIEAEVIGLLKNNQLLLNSRLGQILTSNSLDYKPGDRINLRLDESSGQAVLKASTPPVKPYRLDSRDNPELAQALPAGRPVLARVSRVLAQGTEIRLAEQVIRLSRKLDSPKNQLLSLQRNDSQRSIEIRPLADKAIYKAVLQQLLPRQTQAGMPALLRLLDFAGTISRTAGDPPPTAVAGSISSAASNRSSAARPIAQQYRQSAAPGSPLAGAGLVNSAAGTSSENTGGADRNGRGRLDRMPPNMRNAVSENGAGRPGAKRSTAATNRSSSAIIGASPVPSAARPTRPAEIDTAANRPASGKVSQRPVPAANTAVVSASGGKASRPNDTADVAASLNSSARQVKVARAASGPAAANVSSEQRSAPQAGIVPPAGADLSLQWSLGGMRSAASLPSLQPLLQFVTALADIDATQVRKWFEFSRLLRTSTEPAQSAGDIFRLLKPLADNESLGRELAQSIMQRSVHEGEAAAQRSSANEALLLQMREGARLVEQSLAHNLQQRATLGLQQETQQPLSLSLALPFVDQQQLRPVFLDLQQRKQAQDQANRSWELRLSFELGGLGSIACHLLLEGVDVAASFYSEDEATRARIETELPQLRQQLSRAGFSPGELHSFRGRPTPARQPGAADFSEALIDLEA